MPMPTTGPQTRDGMGMAKAMGGTRSNGNAPQPAIGGGAPGGMQPAMPFVPNGGLQFTPRPAAVASMGAGLQQHATQAPMTAQSNNPVAGNYGTTNFIGNPGQQQYGYTAATGQKSDGTEDKYMSQQQAQIDRMQGNLKGAVQGYGDQEQYKMQQQVGNLLGQQNSIGGLRSGGVEQGVANFGDQFGREIGDYASQTAVQGQQQGLEANDQIQSLTGAKSAKDQAKKNAWMGAIGSGLGIAAGFI